MELSLSSEISNERFDIVNKKCDKSSSNTYDVLDELENEIIDVAKIDFDDEKWLYAPPISSNIPIDDLKNWLYDPVDNSESEDFLSNRLRLAKEVSKFDKNKHIDTRTFTRPKKRFIRPSIEKYNEQVYGSDTSSEMNSSSEGLKRSFDSGVCFNNAIQEINEPVASKPLEFDLTQSTNSYYFENIVANASDIDTFQNMSPPSLVNSMCSSTFANLMESSFIKNDPVLREIRDTDYTETILLEDSEPPMFQSFTESCSSINSDTPENFLKKINCNGTFKKNMAKDVTNTSFERANAVQDATFRKSESPTRLNEPIKLNETFKNLNGTYRRPAKKSNTFTKADRTVKLNSTFSLSNNEIDLDDITIKKDNMVDEAFQVNEIVSGMLQAQDDNFEEIKKRFSDEHIKDSNRWSQIIDDKDIDLEILEKSAHINCSTGSADSLDRMSSLSNSSRGSSKIFNNMADVDAIIEEQAKNLQIMSTPKPNSQKRMVITNQISPISYSDANSDSDETSSNENYKSVRSSLSKISLDNYVSNPIKSASTAAVKPNNLFSKNLSKNTLPHNTHTIIKQKSMQNVPTSIRGSYTNLKTMSGTLSASQSKLNRPISNQKPSNLKTISHNLKGSYTSLKPINAYLPVAPPITSTLNTTTTLTKASNPNVTQIVDRHVKPTEMHKEKSNDGFVKPQPPRASGLPRPVGSGIPRPSFSKIPGPRTSIVRPPSNRPSKQYSDG